MIFSPIERLVPLSKKGMLQLLIILGVGVWVPFSCGEKNADVSQYLAQAESANALGRPDWVRHFLGEALAVAPDLPQAWSQLGDANLAGFEGSIFKGIEAYEKALALDADLTRTRVDLAKAFHRQGKATQVLEILKPVGSSAEVLTLRAQAKMQEDPKAAWTLISEAIQIGHQGEKPHFEAAEIARILGDWQAVARHARLARQDWPWKASAAYLEASAWAQLGEEKAQLEAQAIFKLLQKYLAAKGDHRQTSLEKLKLTEQIKPYWLGSWPHFYANQIYLQIYAGQRDAVERTWRELASNLSLKLAEKHELAAVLLAGGHYSKVAKVMATLSASEKALPTSVLLQAQLDIKRQRFQEVETLLSQALEGPVPLAPYYYWRGKARLWLEKETLAHEDFENAAALAPWMANYQIALAKSWLGRGDRAEAAASLKGPFTLGNAQIDAFIRENDLGREL